MPPFDASRTAAPDAANAAAAAPHAEPAAGASSIHAPMPPFDASRTAAPDATHTAPDAAPAYAARRPHSPTPLDASHAAAPNADPAFSASRPRTSTPPVDVRVPSPVAARSDRADPDPQRFDTPPFDAYDDLPWTDEAPSPAPPTAPAVPDDVRTLDWTTLADRVAGCELCRLCERRTNAVFGVGDREADWMLIGEAPGENEDKEGEPFVGQAGKLLDNMLHALGLSRESNVYIANVIKCRPPGNRNPELDEVARCEPYLQRQVELVKPKIIVALGRFAAQSLLKSEASIASLRGRVHEYRGVPVVVTYHPAYLLRSLPDKAKAWADLCLARKTHADALAALGVQPGAASGKGARG
ncbi:MULTISPECIES: uracil-DNA glycosylase [unclassified Caballeronia]|uniref:uracil-DNA glycosylase n=1 Tax=unclassified Caballeronia TaxID=2646786 RepID=UPI0038579E7B